MESSDDWMLYVVLQHEKKKNRERKRKKLHSVVVESRELKFQLHMALEENEPNMTATKAAKEIKQKAKQACQKDMKKTWTMKPLRGRYLQRTDNSDVDTAATHQWLSSSSLKGETEGFILVAQDQSIPTRVYQSRILINEADPICRLCTNNKEAVDHIILGCPTVENRKYFQRHDQVAKYIHWTLCKHYEIPHSEKWYEHTPEPVV